MQGLDICNQLERDGLAVCPGFLAPDLVEAARKDLIACADVNPLQRAQIGRGTNRIVTPDVRRDSILWLEPDAQNSVQIRLFKQIDDLRTLLNRSLYLGLESFETHYSLYPPGGFYNRHLDTFRDNDARCVSFIVYLNPNWMPEHGGQLRIYRENETFRDIEPHAGTLACFLSREIEHEVLTTNSPRFSLTGWFKTHAKR